VLEHAGGDQRSGSALGAHHLLGHRPSISLTAVGYQPYGMKCSLSPDRYPPSLLARPRRGMAFGPDGVGAVTTDDQGGLLGGLTRNRGS
jgi:hypothetical protein